MSKENLFCQAAFPRSIWELAVKVMNMFENGELKNQEEPVFDPKNETTSFPCTT